MPGRVLCAALLAAFLVILPHLAQADDSAPGAKLYVNFCQGCHGADRSGIGQFAGEFETLQLILEGETIDQMPDFYGVFDDEDVAALYAYLTTPL